MKQMIIEPTNYIKVKILQTNDSVSKVRHGILLYM